MSLQRVTRSEWNAATPKRQPRVIAPSRRKGVVIHWNGPPLRLDPSADPSSLRRRETAVVRAVQRFHQGDNNWSDSAYSYMVGQSGTVFEIRGEQWDQFANGADSVGDDDGADNDFYTIMVMIGTGETPTPAAVNAVRSVIGHLRDLGTGDRVLPHNAFKRKTCPGVELTELAHALDRTPIPRPGAPESVGLLDWSSTFIVDARSSVYSAPVELWQRALLASGFDPGPIDGLVGSKTKGANREFAAAMGDPVLDLPSDGLWSALLENMTSTPVERAQPDRRRRRRRNRRARP